MNINALIEAYSGKAYLSAYRLTGNQADACDLVQETFVRVIKKAELYDESFDFGGWLYRILFRVYLNGRRARERRHEVPLGTHEDETLSSSSFGSEPEGSPEKTAEAAELRARLSSALDGLPPDLRACVVLVDVEGRCYEEAGAILGWPVGSVSGRLFRARRMLRERLGHAEGGRI